MAVLTLGHVFRLVSSILDTAKWILSNIKRLGGQLVYKTEIIFGKLAAMEMRQCHNSMSENEAIRLLENDFMEWRPEISHDYFPRQWSYMMFKLHCVRKGLGLETNDQLQGELLATHLKYHIKQDEEWEWDDGTIQHKLQILGEWSCFFKDLEELNTPAQLYKHIILVEGKLRDFGIAYASLGDRPYFFPGVGTPKRGWGSRVGFPEQQQAVADSSSTAV